MAKTYAQKKREKTEAVRKVVREIISTRFDNNLSRAANELGLRQSTLNGFAGPRADRGCGDRILDAVMNYTGMTLEELLTGKLLDKTRTKPEVSETIAYATRWLGVSPETVDRVMKRHKDINSISAGTLLDQLRVVQCALEFDAHNDSVNV